MAVPTASVATSNPDAWIQSLMRREIPHIRDVRHLLNRVREELSKENTVLSVQAPVAIVGDIHGQFYDLQELFKVSGFPPETNYLFMGDYVNRGYFSVETVLLLFSLKVRYPNRIHLLRGGHESRQASLVYGFYDECMRKFRSSEVWELCNSAFDSLALAALVGQDTPDCRFAVHSGISPHCDTVDEIKQIDRFMEVPNDGPLQDLLWTQPIESTVGWGYVPKGCNYSFGRDIVSQFNRTNNIMQITRSNQLVMTGYREVFDKQLVTIWSAPNYCYRCKNSGAVLELDEMMNHKYTVYGPCPQQERKKPSDEQASYDYPDYLN